ncbi:MAG: LON peptidase substrate-binding domain-containing protein, partial [Thermodesulfobacteriota bacterium]
MSDDVINHDVDGQLIDEQLVIPGSLPLLPIRDVVVFPFMIVPLFVGREQSINAIDSSLTKDRLIFTATQKDPAVEDPAPGDIYETGTVSMIMRMMKLPDGRVKILMQGLARAGIKSYRQSRPSYIVDIEKIKEKTTDEIPLKVEAMMRNVREHLEQLAALGKVVFQEIMMVIDNIKDPGRLADLVAANLGLTLDEGQTILETLDPVVRLDIVSEFVVKELQVAEMQASIQTQAK